MWGNVGPASQLPGGGLAERYPLGNYALDQHFDAVSASLTGGVDVSRRAADDRLLPRHDALAS